MIPAWVVSVLCAAVAGLIVAYWRKTGATRFLPSLPPLILMTTMYFTTQFSLLNFDDPDVRVILIRPAIALLVISIGASTVISWRRVV